jgi:hypothetical protein
MFQIATQMNIVRNCPSKVSLIQEIKRWNELPEIFILFIIIIIYVHNCLKMHLCLCSLCATCGLAATGGILFVCVGQVWTHGTYDLTEKKKSYTYTYCSDLCSCGTFARKLNPQDIFKATKRVQLKITLHSFLTVLCVRVYLLWNLFFLVLFWFCLKLFSFFFSDAVRDVESSFCAGNFRKTIYNFSSIRLNFDFVTWLVKLILSSS